MTFNTSFTLGKAKRLSLLCHNKTQANIYGIKLGKSMKNDFNNEHEYCGRKSTHNNLSKSLIKMVV